MARYGIGPRASTVAFLTLTSAQLLHRITSRTETAAAPLLGTARISLADVLVCAVASLVSLAANEGLKRAQTSGPQLILSGKEACRQ